MKTLLIDTSFREIGMGIFKNKVCLYEKYITAEKRYNEIVEEAKKFIE